MDGDIKLYGSYVLEKGSYNFSLQDIITRDFSIKEGSRVSFHGDPMATNLDISAIYSLSANLLDLDENFANDKRIIKNDSTRTNYFECIRRRTSTRPKLRHSIPYFDPRRRQTGT